MKKAILLLPLLAAVIVVSGCTQDRAERQCSSDSDCSAGQFCDFESCLDARGECADVPDACTEEYRPVCGCGGETYSNDCARKAAKESKAHDGVCGSVSSNTYTIQEIARHNSEGDCWMVIDSRVYDVTGFISSHPGSAAIVEGCGRDATTLFNERQREDGTKVGSGTPHSQNAVGIRDSYYIGDLE